ncbi:MAG: acetyltransferase [Crocinitomicaceae bacterium]
MIKEKEIIIVGAGGHARVVIEIANLLGYVVKGIIDLNFDGQSEIILGVNVIGGVDKLKNISKDTNIAIAIGDNKIRSKYVLALKKEGFSLPVLIHPAAIVSKTSVIGNGSLICAGVIITTEVKIGIGSIVNTGSIIDHESEIHDFVHVAPGVCIAGRTKIGRFTFIGIGSSIIDKIEIDENVSIGAGSTIVKNIPSNSKVVGVSKLI